MAQIERTPKPVYLVSLYYRANVQSGANKRLECLAASLSKNDAAAQVSVVVPETETQGLDGSGAAVVPVPVSKFGTCSRLLQWIRLALLLRSLPSGVVVSDFMPPVPAVGGHRMYQLVHDVRALDGHRRNASGSRLVARIYLFMLRRTKSVMTVSTASAKRIAKAHGQAEIVIVPNGLSTEYGSPINTRERRYDILCIGTFEHRKNYERVVHAINGLVKRGMSLQCLFIGADGGEKKNVSDCVDRLGLQGIIKFAAQIRDEAQFVTETYDQARVYCCASLYEGFGMPLIEATARACKVVCSDIEPFRELDLPGARYCDPLFVDSIQTALLEALNDRALPDDAAVRNYSWAAMAEKFVEVTRSG